MIHFGDFLLSFPCGDCTINKACGCHQDKTVQTTIEALSEALTHLLSIVFFIFLHVSLVTIFPSLVTIFPINFALLWGEIIFVVTQMAIKTFPIRGASFQFGHQTSEGWNHVYVMCRRSEGEGFVWIVGGKVYYNCIVVCLERNCCVNLYPLKIL